MRTYYTAIGNFRRRQDNEGCSYPVIIVNREEYMVDVQEIALSQLAHYGCVAGKFPRCWIMCLNSRGEGAAEHSIEGLLLREYSITRLVGGPSYTCWDPLE